MVFNDSSEISITIRNAVRHLQQLSQSFQTDTFTADDLQNIDYVADTLIVLEKEILKLHSDYETESIDSSRLRHRLKILPTTIKNEIQAAVLMARESNVSVIQGLQRELDAQLQQLRSYTEQDNELNAAIGALQAEKNALQNQYDVTIHEVNERISEKSTLQINLNETRDTVRETNEHTFDLEEEMMSLKEHLMQERNDARQEKGRLEDDYNATLKRYDDQERANEKLKKDVDQATHQVSESELQLRSMYRERERFENESGDLRMRLDEQYELFDKEQLEHDRLLLEQLQFAENCGIALLDFQTKKAALEERLAMAHERSNEETENLKGLKQKHDEVVKHIDEEATASKTLEATIAETGRELEEIKQEIASKLEKTAQLNLDNAQTTEELEAMREAHQMMIDSLKLQMNTLDKELQHIRDTRIAKQKERDNLLKTIEQTKLTSRNNDIRHNRFVTQTTGKVTDLSERKVILDRNAREDQLQLGQLEDGLFNLKDEYRQMKTLFEEQIKYLEETTTQLLSAIQINRQKVSEETPEFEQLNAEHARITHLYEITKETMIETKRKKQELLDRISGIERTIRAKNKSRDITMFSVKESQRESQERMQQAHDDLMILEEEIYDKGCRLETLEHENERFEQTINYLQYQMNLFQRFSAQSHVDIEGLDENNHHLLETLESGWKDDRQLEHRSAEKDLAFIDDLTVLLRQTEKRKAKVGTVVHRLIGELQNLKYYLEGMSSPPTPAPPAPSTGRSSSNRSLSSRRQQRRRRSISNDRIHSAATGASEDRDQSGRRPHSATQAYVSAPTPYPMTKDVQERVSNFVETNFHLRPHSAGKKPDRSAKMIPLTSQRSARMDLSAPSPDQEIDRKKTPTINPKVAFA